MVNLSSVEISYLLELIREKHGSGYSQEVVGGVNIGTLQATLSMLLEVAVNRE